MRHAEKLLDSEDPKLSAEGTARANALASMLSDAGVTTIHSTDFRRTLDTIQPLSRLTGLKPQLYDPRQPGTLLKTLTEQGGRHVIVGHSNTVPELVQLLGGDPGADIDEEKEYDRLYVITIREDGSQSVLLRYGN